MTTSRGSRAGFSLVETMIAVALLGVVLLNVYMALSDGSRAMQGQTATNEVEVQARRALDRIALAVLGAARDSLWTTQEAPLCNSELNLVSSLGMIDGEPVWSDPQRISMADGSANHVVWTENPGQPTEKRVVWGSHLRDFAEHEIGANGIDDNGNGLIDEKGLAFDIEGDSVRIRLTIERPGPDGKPMVRSVETVVTCRN
jgi:prepilin-type N-terminal cleavage/methylation domain-containing protein